MPIHWLDVSCNLNIFPQSIHHVNFVSNDSSVSLFCLQSYCTLSIELFSFFLSFSLYLPPLHLYRYNFHSIGRKHKNRRSICIVLYVSNALCPSNAKNCEIVYINNKNISPENRKCNNWFIWWMW